MSSGAICRLNLISTDAFNAVIDRFTSDLKPFYTASRAGSRAHSHRAKAALLIEENHESRIR